MAIPLTLYRISSMHTVWPKILLGMKFCFLTMFLYFSGNYSVLLVIFAFGKEWFFWLGVNFCDFQGDTWLSGITFYNVLYCFMQSTSETTCRYFEMR